MYTISLIACDKSKQYILHIRVVRVFFTSFKLVKTICSASCSPKPTSYISEDAITLGKECLLLVT